MKKAFFLILFCFTSILLAQTNNNVENNSADVFGKVGNSATSYGSPSATFFNPARRVEGSVYLFDKWTNQGVIYTSDSQKFSLKNINLNIERSTFESKISEDSIFTFNFNNKKNACLRCFYQEETISDDILNCEYEGILGTIAGIIGTMQANEILKKILNVGNDLNGYILILDLLNLNFRKVKFNKSKIKIYPFKSFPTFKIFIKTSLDFIVPIIPVIVPSIHS